MSARHSWDPVWEDVFSSQRWGRYPPEHVIRFVARTFGEAAERHAVRLLDVGCGPGANSWFMAREGFSVSAIDGSPTGIEQLRQRCTSEGLAVDARVGDFVELPWADATFHGAIDNASIYSNPFDEARRAVEEVLRVLVPGGWFHSATFTDRTWGYGTGRMVEPGGFTDLTAGPLAGKGFALFLGRARLEELYDGFTDLHVERSSYTLDGEQQLVEQWLVTARKPG